MASPVRSSRYSGSRPMSMRRRCSVTRSRLPAGGGHGRVRVHRARAAPPWVDLEVEMWRATSGVPRVAVGTDGRALTHACARRNVETGQVGVIEGDPVVANEPDGLATQTAAPEQDLARSDGVHRLVPGGEHVRPLVPATTRPGIAPGVDERGSTR